MIWTLACSATSPPDAGSNKTIPCAWLWSEIEAAKNNSHQSNGAAADRRSGAEIERSAAIGRLLTNYFFSQFRNGMSVISFRHRGQIPFIVCAYPACVCVCVYVRIHCAQPMHYSDSRTQSAICPATAFVPHPHSLYLPISGARWCFSGCWCCCLFFLLAVLLAI